VLKLSDKRVIQADMLVFATTETSTKTRRVLWTTVEVKRPWSCACCGKALKAGQKAYRPLNRFEDHYRVCEPCMAA